MNEWEDLQPIPLKDAVIWTGLYKHRYYTSLQSVGGTLHLVVYDLHSNKESLYQRVYTRQLNQIKKLVEERLS